VTTPGQRTVGVVTELAGELDRVLATADAELVSGYPGDGPGRQPVHTAYMPAHRFERGSPVSWGAEALAAVAEHCPDPGRFADAMGLARGVAEQVHALVLAKLAAEPVEDLRIDFEDGYGVRGDETEDAHARAAARSLAAALGEDSAPPFCGIRVKSLERPTRLRALRTLDVFLGTLLGEGGRPLPHGFVITVPKVTSAAQVSAMVLVCERLEAVHGIGSGAWLPFEIQVETPQLICGPDGAATIARCVHSAAGRLTGLHYGTYDYSAALGIAAAQQSLDHPAADYAKSVMQVAAAGSGVWLSDGSTSILPAGTGEDVVAGWRLHARLVRRSLERGFYQGWDLHPAQLVSRYATTYAFYREGLPAACDRLREYTRRAAAGQEEPATARALAGYILRALHCDATTENEVTESCGLDPAQLFAARVRGKIPTQISL